MPQSAPTEGSPAAGKPLPAIGRLVARHRRRFVIRKLAGLCRRFLAWHGNVSYDLATNGEGFVLQVLADFHPRLLLDVGANVGDWTAAARSRCPEAVIHAFEISGPTFETLVKNTRHLPNVRCQNVGLSDVEGDMSIRHYPNVPSLTTASDYPHPFAFTELPVKTTTGDVYCAQQNIQHVDLMKIDVEGMEIRVLNGLENMFARQAIDMVQFEYGRVSILNKYLLRDFYAFFNERGYAVGKIYPNYVDFRDYDFGDEDFMGPNFLACRRDKQDLLHALAGRRVAATPA